MTDSAYLRVVRDLGQRIKSCVNKSYKSLEIDIDGVFRSILLLRKKKYAAISVVDWAGEGTNLKKEVKGLDMVRRDWCPLSQRCSDHVLDKVLSGCGEGSEVVEEVVTFMRGVADRVRAGNVFPLEDYVISKSLTKEPSSYKGAGFPHATVALRMKQRNEQVRVGDLIPYVICESGEGPNDRLSDRAFHVDEVRASNRRLDGAAYLLAGVRVQVLYIVALQRLCRSSGLQRPVPKPHPGASAFRTAAWSALYGIGNVRGH
jgi:DNA polymerase alpha subunit A